MDAVLALPPESFTNLRVPNSKKGLRCHFCLGFIEKSWEMIERSAKLKQAGGSNESSSNGGARGSNGSKSQLSLHLFEQNAGETEKCLVIAWVIHGRVCGENSTSANSLEQRGFH